MDIGALKSHSKLKNKNARMLVDSSVPVTYFQKQAIKGHVILIARKFGLYIVEKSLK